MGFSQTQYRAPAFYIGRQTLHHRAIREAPGFYLFIYLFFKKRNSLAVQWKHLALSLQWAKKKKKVCHHSVKSHGFHYHRDAQQCQGPFWTDMGHGWLGILPACSGQRPGTRLTSPRDTGQLPRTKKDPGPHVPTMLRLRNPALSGRIETASLG